MHFVAAALPKVPMCAHKLGYRTSPAGSPGALLARQRRARGASAATLPQRWRGRQRKAVFICRLCV